MKRQSAIRSDIAWSTPDRIGVLGYDLTRDLIGRINLGDMGFLEITGRLPNARESRMFNALLVTLVEHGLTPSAIAARMTYYGAPEAMQAAVAAGLCGLGSVFVGSTEACARMLTEALPDPKAAVDLDALANTIVDAYRARKAIVPGIGHPIHKPVDPRVPRLFEIARACGFYGRYGELVERVRRRQAATAECDRRTRRAGLRDGLRLARLPRPRRHGARRGSRRASAGRSPRANCARNLASQRRGSIRTSKTNVVNRA